MAKAPPFSPMPSAPMKPMPAKAKATPKRTAKRPAKGKAC